MNATRTNRATAKSQPPATGGVSLTQRMRSINRWREQYNPLRGLTLSRAVQLGEAYFRGDMADLQWAFFWIEQTDADLLALLECRFSRLLEMDYHVKVAKEAAKKQKSLAAEQTAAVSARIERIDNLYEAVEHLGMASFRGFGHCEKWHTGGQLTHLEIVDQWNTARDGLYGAWKYNPDARSAAFRGLPEANIMPPEAFLFRQVRRPINRIALFKFVRSNLSEKDWDAFNEIYGIPGGVVIGPPNVPAGKEAEYEAAAQDIAEGGSGYLPNASTYTANVGPRGTQPFKERLDHLSEKLVLAGTGGKLTMLTEAGSGTLAGGAHADVFKQISKGDARRVSEAITKQLVAGWLAEDFPGQPALAYFELAANEEADTGKAVGEIKTLSDAGYQVAPEEVSERTGYTVTLKPAPAAPAAPGFRPPGAPAIANRQSAAAAGRKAIYEANAKEAITAAQLAAVRPLFDRLAALDRIPDAEFPAALAKLKTDLPGLYTDAMKRAPEAAKAWEAVLGTALIDGFGTAAKAQNGAVQPPKQPPSIANRASKRAVGPCKGRATPSRKP